MFWSNDKLNYLKWKNFEYQVVRYHQDLNFLYRQFFHLRKFKLPIPTKSWISHKLYETISVNCGFSTTPPNTLSNAKMVYILNVDFDEWNNIGINDFSIRDHLGFRNWCVAMNSFKIQNWVVQTFPNEKLTIRPNVELDECNKHCIHYFSIWDHLGFCYSMCLQKPMLWLWLNLVKWHIWWLQMKKIWI